MYKKEQIMNELANVRFVLLSPLPSLFLSLFCYEFFDGRARCCPPSFMRLLLSIHSLFSFESFDLVALDRALPLPSLFVDRFPQIFSIFLIFSLASLASQPVNQHTRATQSQKTKLL